jgi:beta-glucosidase
MAAPPLTTAQLMHMAAFKGALAAGFGGCMPTYPIITGPSLGQAAGTLWAGYSKVLLTDRCNKLGYKGIILSDWAITVDCNERCSADRRKPPAPAGHLHRMGRE